MKFLNFKMKGLFFMLHLFLLLIDKIIEFLAALISDHLIYLQIITHIARFYDVFTNYIRIVIPQIVKQCINAITLHIRRK